MTIRTLTETNIDRFTTGNNLTENQTKELIADIKDCVKRQTAEWDLKGRPGKTIGVDGDLTLTDGANVRNFDFHILIDPIEKTVVILELKDRLHPFSFN